MTDFNQLKTSGPLGALLGALSPLFVALGASDRIVPRPHGARRIHPPMRQRITWLREMQPWRFAA
jgi:hypothetical protein